MKSNNLDNIFVKTLNLWKSRWRCVQNPQIHSCHANDDLKSFKRYCHSW